MALTPVAPSVLWWGALYVVRLAGGPLVFPVTVDVVLVPAAPPEWVLGRLHEF